MAFDTTIVRQAVPDDESALLSLLRAMDAEDGGTRSNVITAEHLRSFVFSTNPRAEGLLAVRSGVPIGLAAIHMSASTFWCNTEVYLDDLFVVPEFRRLGVGRRLLREVASLALRRSTTRILLNVQSDNPAAVHFYESLGGTVFPESRACAFAGKALEQLANVDLR